MIISYHMYPYVALLGRIKSKLYKSHVYLILSDPFVLDR